MFLLQQPRAQIFRIQDQEMEPSRKIAKDIFGWDYNTWYICHYYIEYGHIVENCIKCYTRKRDTTKRCFVCIKLGQLAKNNMNQGRVENEKKAKDKNIRSHMRQQWVRKSPKDAN